MPKRTKYSGAFQSRGVNFLPSQSMYDCLTEELWKELGQVDPDWFQVLTTRASKEANLSDSDDQEELCPNQEANFKTPLRKTVSACVPQSSTPRVFRRSCVASPDSADQQENELLPWGARSLSLFGPTKDTVPHSNDGIAHSRIPDWLDLIHTPQASLTSYTRQIAESLGADLHPDISWTSSLNTPPPLPSTLILSKTDESPSTMTICMDKSAVLVRKLFPSLSNNVRAEVAAVQNSDPLEVLRDADLPEASPHPTPQKSPQRSPEQPPEAAGDRVIQSPAAGVLDRTENNQCAFPTDSEGRERRQEDDGNASDVATEPKSSDQAQPVEPEDNALTQWSPLSLSDIALPIAAAAQVADQCATSLASEANCARPIRLSFNFAAFTKKKTKFIYVIDKEKHSVKDTYLIPDNKLPANDGKEELQQREEKPPSSLQDNPQDLDMSQLGRAFAQDFSQMSCPSAPRKLGLPPPPRGFSPLTRPTASKFAPRKTKSPGDGEAPLDESGDSGFLSAGADISQLTASCAEKREASHPNKNNKQNELCSEDLLLDTWTDTKDASAPTPATLKELAHHLVSVQSHEETANVSPLDRTSDKRMEMWTANVQKAEGLFEQQQPIKSESHSTASISEKCTRKDENSKVTEESPQDFSQSFKQGHIAPESLANGYHDDVKEEIPAHSCPPRDSQNKCLEEDRSDTNGFSSPTKQGQNAPESPGNSSAVTCQGDQASECRRDAREQIPATPESPNYQLSASQKADVKALCSLLEEEGSQFDFTQFRSIKSEPKADKVLEPSLLTGMDFNDSFCAEAKEKSPINPEEQAGVAKQPLLAHKMESEETIPEKLEESVPSVYKKCLTKSKHLFPPSVENSSEALRVHGSRKAHQFIDASENVEPLRGFFSSVQGASKMMPRVPHNGFQMASGKSVVISPSAMQRAQSVFKENPADGKPLTNMAASLNLATGKSQSVSAEAQEEQRSLSAINAELSGFQTAAGKQVAVSAAALNKAKSLLDDCPELEEHPAHRSTFRKSEPASFSSNTLDLGSTSKSNPQTLDAQNLENGANSDFPTGGFSTASGKKVSVSEGALAKAKHILKEDNPSVQSQRGSSSLLLHQQQLDGFQTAKGKPLAVSSAALKKAKLLLDACTEVKEDPACRPPDRKSDLEKSALFLDQSLLENVTSASENPDKDITDSRDAMSAVGASESKLGNETAAPLREHRDVSGFSTASGKSVSVSDEAMTRAKSIWSDASVQNDKRDSLQNVASPAAGGRRAKFFTSDVPTSPSAACGFSTASGKNVLVSDNAVARAKALLDDKDSGFPSSAAEKKATHPLNEDRDPKTGDKMSSCGFSSASGRPVAVSSRALLKAKALFDEVAPLGAHEKNFSVPSPAALAQTPSTRFGEEGNPHRWQTSNETPEDGAMVNLEPSDLTDCTETQQLFLAREALDCTKALLEDENIAASLEDARPEKDACCHVRGQAPGKRSAENTQRPEQPPAKRALLDQLDRCVDSRRGVRLCPLTSCPKGLTKDRPALTSNVLLGPNITRPLSDGTGYMEAAASPRSERQPSLTLLPPWFKKGEAQRRRNDDAISPPAFVPPFRRVVEQSAIKPFGSDPQKTTQSSMTAPHAIASDQSMSRDVSIQSPPADACWSQGTAPDDVELARDMQDMRICKKKHQTIRPLPGALFRAKASGAARIRLKDAVAQRPPTKYTRKQLYECGVHEYVCDVTGQTAEAFRFHLQLFYKKEALAGIQLADGGRLIPGGDGTAGKEHFYKALCDTPGVDPKLMSDDWVHNHYRWIVWKLACMERSFPESMGGRCLTPERVLLQLKYRYDVEVDHSRRPALRKITEKDDTAAKTLVLCVCGVDSGGPVENACAVVWLTDGWYALRTQLDEPLSQLLRRGRLAEGGKLITHGAQLVGSQEACAPLEAPHSLMLKIFANSTRPARWDTKLGFHRDPRPFLLPLSSLYSNGGPVGCVDIVVLRSYPLQWMERKSDGGVVFRSARAEEKEEAHYNSRKQKAMEALYAKMEAELEQEDKESKLQARRRSVSHRDVKGLQDGQELYEAVGDDLAELEAHLSERQLETLQAYRRSLVDKKRAQLLDRYQNADDGLASCPQRDVTPVWRLCVADSLNPTGAIYQLNLWRPSSDTLALLKEGRRYKVYNLTTSNRKKRDGLATLQLSANIKTQFQDLQVTKLTSPEWLSACFQPRVSTEFVALQNLEFHPPCGEVDLTGCVVSVLDGKGPSPAFYLVDRNMNFVKVRCFISLLQADLLDVMRPGVLLALSNLQLRGQSTRPTPVVYAGDLTVFSTNPKEEHLQKVLAQLRNLVRERENFLACAEDKLSQVLKSDVWSSVCSPSLKTPPTQHLRTNPIKSLGCFTPLSRNFQPPANASSSEKDPRTWKRRRAVDSLSRVPSPPLFLHPRLAASPSVNKTFTPPRRANAPLTSKSVPPPNLPPLSASPPEVKEEDAWVNDHELAMIDTQALHVSDAL
ncbi:breast cancer type 2 susceptibility protein isoform X2 [Syngnathus scovelli]|uniref:breast cancer type 2 susceptibility protein isoform X2 n=1 Tax=Syngnathus scovelli TaxID=161590 RepID=UPI002110DC16|nr:breast cancer type 2 susceptibility protein isoform X2 [Syngnathus scovelli]